LVQPVTYDSLKGDGLLLRPSLLLVTDYMVWIGRPWVTQHDDLKIISDLKIFSNSFFFESFPKSEKFMVKD